MPTFSDLEPGPTIYWPAGTSARWRLTIRQCKTCPALDLSGDDVEVEFILKRSATASDATAKFIKKLSTGGIVGVDLALGIVDVIVDADDTVAADGVGEWFYTTRVTLDTGEILQPFGLSGTARLDLTVPTDCPVVSADSTTGTIDPVALTPAPLPAYATIAYVTSAVAAEATLRTAGDAATLASAATDATTKANAAEAAAIAASAQRASNLSDLASAATARTNLGLGNVDNTSDANKPVSTAQATAIALKLDADEKGAANGVAELDAYENILHGGSIDDLPGYDYWAAFGDSFSTGSPGYQPALKTRMGLPVYDGAVGGETSTQIKVRMLAATTTRKYTHLIWAGRNNSGDPTTVQADIAAMVAAIGHDRYLVLGILKGSADSAGTKTGIDSLNAALAATYGDKFLDVDGYMLGTNGDALADMSITPTAQDLIDRAAGYTPSSLRTDTLHLNANGNAAVALLVSRTNIQHAGIARTIGAALASFGEIGGVSTGVVRSSSLYVNGKLIDTAGDGNIRFGCPIYPDATRTRGLGAGNAIWGSTHTADFQLYTSSGTSAGGGAQVNSSAGAEKWRIGLRGMISGSEGNDLIFGYFNGSSRANTIVMSAGSLTAPSYIGAQQALSGAGAVDVVTQTTLLTTTGANALTLANGTAGQRKTIIHVVDGGDGTLTPTTKTGYTTITFTAVGQSVTLEYVTTLGWMVVHNYGATVA